MRRTSGFSSVHPRACGEHATGVSGADDLVGSSPRVRGTLPGRVIERVFVRFIPARAGMNRLVFFRRRKIRSVPRTRGDEPQSDTKQPEWAAFPPESQTLGIPRADMPQIKAAHRGALANFLQARGITHTTETIDAGELKATQAEFSPAKVAKAKAFTDTNRSILVSRDNHILDGHHQWLAKAEKGESIEIIRLNADIRELLPVVKEFPSAGSAKGAKPKPVKTGPAGGVKTAPLPEQNAGVNKVIAASGVKPVAPPIFGQAADKQVDQGIEAPGSEAESIDPLRPMVEALIKRRAAARESGIDRSINTAIERAKAALSGGDSSPGYFSKLAKTIKGKDAESAKILDQIAAHLKAPKAEAKPAELKGMSDAEVARRQKLRQKAVARRRIDMASDSIITAIAKLGGLSMDHRLDLIGDDKGNRQVSFVGHLFSRNGRGLDDMATSLGQYGYLTEAELEDVDGGVQTLRDKIRDEYDGTQRHYSSTGEAERMANDRDMAGLEEQERAEASEIIEEFIGDDESIPTDLDWSTMTEDEKNAETDALFSSENIEAVAASADGGAQHIAPETGQPDQAKAVALTATDKTPSKEGVSVSALTKKQREDIADITAMRDAMLALIDAKEAGNVASAINANTDDGKTARAGAAEDLKKAVAVMRLVFGKEEATPLLDMTVAELYDFYEAIAGTKREEKEVRAEPAALELTGESPEDLAAKAGREAQAGRAKKKADADAELKEKEASDKTAIKKASAGAAGSFELTQTEPVDREAQKKIDAASSEQNLSGQGDVFAKPASAMTASDHLRAAAAKMDDAQKPAAPPAERPARTDQIGSGAASNLDSFLADMTPQEAGSARAALSRRMTERNAQGNEIQGPVSTAIENKIKDGWSIVLTASGQAFVGKNMQGWDKGDIGAYGMQYAGWLSGREKPAAAQAPDPAAQPATDPKKGDRFTDASGKEFEVWSSRHGSVEAFPVVNGKMKVGGADTSEFWAIGDAAKARYPESRTDFNPLPKEKRPVTPQVQELTSGGKIDDFGSKIEGALQDEGTYVANSGNRVENSRRGQDDYTKDLFGKTVSKDGGADMDDNRSSKKRDVDATATLPGEQKTQPPVIVELAQRGVLRVGFDRMDTPEKVAHAFAALRKSPREHFQILLTDGNDKPLSVWALFSGTIGQTAVHAREVILAAYMTPGAKKIWFAHNHPGGTPTPSGADLALTKLLGQGFASELGIKFAGHVIIAGNRAVAFDNVNYSDNQSTFEIPPASRKYAVPIMERVIRRQRFGVGQVMDGPATVRDYFTDNKPQESGLLLLSPRLAVMTWLPMSEKSMATLKDGNDESAGAKLFKAIGRLNPATAIVYSPEPSTRKFERAVENVGTALNLIDVRVLDAVTKESNGKLRLLAEQGGSLGGPDGVFFSLGPRVDRDGGMDINAAVAVVDGVVASQKDWNVDVAAVAEFDDLPAQTRVDAINQYGEEAARNAKGVTHQGKVYVIAQNNASEADVETTILHEVEGHVGIHRLYGAEIKRELNALYLDIGGRAGLTRLANERGVAADLVEYAKLLGQSKFSDEVRVQIMMDEALAHFAQRPKFGDRVKAIVGLLRAWLREHGFVRLAQYGETDLLNILRKGRRQLKKSSNGASNPTALMAGRVDLRYQRDQVAKYAEGLGYTILDSHGSGLSSSTYLNLAVNAKVDEDGGVMDYDREIKIRFSDHDLPPSYKRVHGEADYEVSPVGRMDQAGGTWRDAIKWLAEKAGKPTPPAVAGLDNRDQTLARKNALLAAQRGVAIAESRLAEYNKAVADGKVTASKSRSSKNWNLQGDFAGRFLGLGRWDGETFTEAAAIQRGREVFEKGVDNAKRTLKVMREADSGTAMFSRTEAPERGFSASERETVDRVQAWIAPALAKLKNIPAVEIVYDQMQIPAVARRMRALSVAVVDGDAQSGKDLTGFADRPVEGAYINGKIWLVASTLRTKDRTLAVLAHEAVGHLAVQSMLDAADPKLMPRLISQVKMLDAGGNKYIRELAVIVDRRQPGLGKDERAGEIIALIPERGDQAKSFGGMVRSVYRRIIDGIKAFYKLVFDQNLSDADVRDIVATAERWAQGEEHVTATVNGKSESADIRFSRAIREEGIPAEASEVIREFTDDAELKAHPDYKAAKAGDAEAAARLVRALVSAASLDVARDRFGSDVVYVPVMAQEATGHNQIPNALAMQYAEATGGTVVDGIVQSNAAHHTGARPLERMAVRPIFDGDVVAGKRHVLVDDVTTMGGTFSELADHIRAGGGEVAGIVSIVNAARTGDNLSPAPHTIKLIERRFGDAIEELFGVKPSAITRAEAQYILNFKDADALRASSTAAIAERRARLAAKGIPEGENHEVSDGGPSNTDGTALSRGKPPYAGMQADDVKALAHLFRNKFKGLPTIYTLQSIGQAPAALRADIKDLGGVFPARAGMNRG